MFCNHKSLLLISHVTHPSSHLGTKGDLEHKFVKKNSGSDVGYGGCIGSNYLCASYISTSPYLVCDLSARHFLPMRVNFLRTQMSSQTTIKTTITAASMPKQ
jgi:hypothetical protein